MQPIRTIVRRYKSTHIAHQEKLARPRTCQQMRYQAGVRTTYEQRSGVLPLIHEGLELLPVLRKGVLVETAQALQ